jgi:hypothetical protein
MIIPIVHWKIFKLFLNILSNGTFFKSKNSGFIKIKMNYLQDG